MRFKFWLGIAVSAALLVYLFTRIDIARLWESMRSADPLYLLAAGSLTIVFFLVRALRWRYIMDTVKHDAPFVSLFSATMIGFMANNVLPARLGEFARAYAFGRKENVSKSSTFATIVVERLFDGMAVLMLLVVTLAFLPPVIAGDGAVGTVRKVGMASLGLYAVIIAMLVYFLYRPDLPAKGVRAVIGPVSAGFADKAAGMADSFMHGLGAVKNPLMLFYILFYTAVHWGLLWMPIYVLFKGFGMGFGVYESVYLLVLMCLSVALPSTPGYVGTFHAAATGGLVLLGVDTETALGFAIVAHAVNYIPVTLIGLYFMSKESLSLKSMKNMEVESQT